MEVKRTAIRSPVKKKKNQKRGTTPADQWLRLCEPNAGGWGLIPGQGTRSHTPQQRSGVPQLRPSAAK